MDALNYIESKYRELDTRLNTDYLDLYSSFNHDKLKVILSTLHYIVIENYKSMNTKLPTSIDSDYFWADNSRELLVAIEIYRGLESSLKNSDYALRICEYYANIFNESLKFLKKYRGSQIPPNTSKIELYFTLPIVIKENTIAIKSGFNIRNTELKLIGEGSYAFVYKYKDEFYNKYFVLKRAKVDLSVIELERFRLEFKQMHEMNSIHIAEVYNYKENGNEYIMECLDINLYKYVNKYNSSISFSQRKAFINQILRGFEYIHSKEILHRDISPTNILLKFYETSIVIKIADFGLVKIPESQLTSFNTELKGIYNDPELNLEGFNNYGILHETYALTRLIFFILTGKSKVSDVQNENHKKFVEKGLSSDKQLRFRNVAEIRDALKSIFTE